MNKNQTLEVLRGMKFMQRKEEAKRRAMYETEQRRSKHKSASQQHNNNNNNSSSSNNVYNNNNRVQQGAESALSDNMPTIYYDDECPREVYALSRQHFAVVEELHEEPHSELLSNMTELEHDNDVVIDGSKNTSMHDEKSECIETVIPIINSSNNKLGSYDTNDEFSSYHNDRTNLNENNEYTYKRKRDNNHHDFDSRCELQSHGNKSCNNDPTAFNMEQTEEQEKNTVCTNKEECNNSNQHVEGKKKGRFYVSGGIRAPVLPKKLRRDMEQGQNIRNEKE